MKSLSRFLILGFCFQLITTNISANEAHSSHHEAQTSKAPTAPPATAAQTHNEHARKKGKTSPGDAYKTLLSGHKRYMKMSLRRDGVAVKDRQRLATGQEPHTIFLSCSDSRVPPEIIFDQGLGEIFVVRTAGEALDSSAIASIEYAVSHLGSNLIVVLWCR